MVVEKLFAVIVLFVLSLTGGTLGVAGCGVVGDFERRVSERVVWQMDNYPESRLVDIYKNFFQDRFGPGHMIADSASAGAYLRSELLKVKGRSQVNLAEVTGWRGDYVRVDLSVITEGLVSYQVFFEAFMESARGIRLPLAGKPEGESAKDSADKSIDDWEKEWKRIEKIAKDSYPDIPDFQKDSRFLDSLLNTGKYVVHHSDTYSKSYDPHYRLFRKDVFETRLKPSL